MRHEMTPKRQRVPVRIDNHPAPRRVYVGVTLDEIRSSIQGAAHDYARILAETHYVGKWVEQDLCVVGLYKVAGSLKCRFKTNEMDVLENLYCGFDPRYDRQIKNWKVGEKIRVRGRIVEVEWDILLEECEVVP
jgi:hypothetical protein